MVNSFHGSAAVPEEAMQGRAAMPDRQQGDFGQFWIPPEGARIPERTAFAGRRTPDGADATQGPNSSGHFRPRQGRGITGRTTTSDYRGMTPCYALRATARSVPVQKRVDVRFRPEPIHHAVAIRRAHEFEQQFIGPAVGWHRPARRAPRSRQRPRATRATLRNMKPRRCAQGALQVCRRDHCLAHQ